MLLRSNFYTGIYTGGQGMGVGVGVVIPDFQESVAKL